MINNGPAQQTFDEWFAENKDSDELRAAYNEIAFEIKQMGFTVGTFEVWARSYYDNIVLIG